MIRSFRGSNFRQITLDWSRRRLVFLSRLDQKPPAARQAGGDRSPGSIKRKLSRAPRSRRSWARVACRTAKGASRPAMSRGTLARAFGLVSILRVRCRRVEDGELECCASSAVAEAISSNSPGTYAAQDCATIDGASTVACVEGQCQGELSISTGVLP